MSMSERAPEGLDVPADGLLKQVGSIEQREPLPDAARENAVSRTDSFKGLGGSASVNGQDRRDAEYNEMGDNAKEIQFLVVQGRLTELAMSIEATFTLIFQVQVRLILSRAIAATVIYYPSQI